MNMKFVKRFLAVSMAATIMVVPMVASAEGSTEGGTGTEQSTIVPPASDAEVNKPADSNPSGETNQGSPEETPKSDSSTKPADQTTQKTTQKTKTAEQTTQSTQSTQSTQTEQESAGEKLNKTMAEKTAASTTAVVAGKTLKSDVAGTVDVTNSKTIKAFILNSANGKTAGDKQTVFSKTAKESPKAFDSANAAAAAIGGTVVGDALNADITLKNGGTAKAVLKDAPAGTVKVIQVADGGATTVLDATVDGTVVTFTPSNGHFTYFIVVI